MTERWHVTCWARSPSTRSHVGLVAPAESREDGLRIGREWALRHITPTGFFMYAPDYEVGYKVEKR